MTYIGANVAATVAAVCFWVLIIVVAHEILHRFLSKTTADNKRRVEQLHETIDNQQRQIDELKCELEELRKHLP